MEEKLVLWQLDLWVLRIDNALSTLLQGGFEERDDVGGVACDFVRKLFIVGDEMSDVDIAEILLDKDILSDLVSVDEGAVELESEDELL
jgi:hypothetical protein